MTKTTLTTDKGPAAPDTRELLLQFIALLSSTQSGKALLRDLRELLKEERVPFTAPPDCSRTEKEITFEQAVLASLHARKHRRPSTLADLRSYAIRLIKFTDWKERPLRSITRQECRQLLNSRFGRSAHIYGKAKNILHSIFAYSQRQGWCEKNPIDGIENRIIIEDTINILTIKEIRKIMKTLCLKELDDMSYAVRLMLWCGVRPGEVQRLRWRDIDRRENVVYVDGRASKTGGARAIPLRGGAICLKYVNRPEHHFIAPRNWARQWRRLRRKAGFHHWQRDALRHTFASYHLKNFHNLYLLQEEMGHRDSSLLRTRYLNLRNITTHAAHAFFRME